MRVGKVVQVIGPVVDVEFAEEELPGIFNAVRITSEPSSRTSFMPGVLMAVRKVAELPESPVIGLEKLLWPS